MSQICNWLVTYVPKLSKILLAEVEECVTMICLQSLVTQEDINKLQNRSMKILTFWATAYGSRQFLLGPFLLDIPKSSDVTYIVIAAVHVLLVPYLAA